MVPLNPKPKKGNASWTHGQAPTSWISPIGLDCVQPYRTPHTVSVRTRRQNAARLGSARIRIGFSGLC